METCPRCGGQLTRADNRDVASIWRVDKDGVVICCTVAAEPRVKLREAY